MTVIMGEKRKKWKILFVDEIKLKYACFTAEIRIRQQLILFNELQELWPF